MPFPEGLHPHFFRGLCTDWLVIDIGVSITSASEFIGDAEPTLKRNYLDKKRPYDAGAALDEANEKVRAKQRPAETVSVESMLKELEAAHRAELARRDEQTADLIRQRDYANERAERAESRVL